MEELSAQVNLNHPHYCVGCGEIQPDSETFTKHYQKCWLGTEMELTEEEIVDLTHNTKHY